MILAEVCPQPSRNRIAGFRQLTFLSLLAIGATMPVLAGESVPARFIARDVVRPLSSSTVSSQPGSITARWSEVKRHRVGNQPGAWRLKWRKPLTSSASPKSEVRQADAESAVSASSNQAPIRDPLGSSSLTPRLASKTELQNKFQVQPAGLVWRDTQSQVQAAVQFEPADPFEDPFDDHARAVTDNDLAPAPRHFAQAPPAQLNDGQPCRRIYNDRNCCEEEQNCALAREYVRNNSIRNISLNITPQLTVAQLTAGDEEEMDYGKELRKELARVPARDWRNRAGRQVANGRMTDFRDGRVIVSDSDGNSVKLPYLQLSDDDMCFVTAWWSIPTECSLGDEEYRSRQWIDSTMAWKASGVCHKPLYFEEVQLERYGHTAGPILQPALSGAHFFLNIAALPYKMGINPPNECRYPLGYYRPGNCAPWLIPPIPLSVRSALQTAGFYTGGVYMIP